MPQAKKPPMVEGEYYRGYMAVTDQSTNVGAWGLRHSENSRVTIVSLPAFEADLTFPFFQTCETATETA